MANSNCNIVDTRHGRVEGTRAITNIVLKLLAVSTWPVVPTSRTTVSLTLRVVKVSQVPLNGHWPVVPTSRSLNAHWPVVPTSRITVSLSLRVVKVSLNAHWMSAVVKTSEDWMRPIVRLFIIYYVSHFYSGINITMTTTTYITIDSRKRASSNTCDAVYYLDRTLQGIQGLKLSNMQFYNTIYSITQYNNTIAFSMTSSGTITTPYSQLTMKIFFSDNLKWYMSGLHHHYYAALTC